VHKELPFLKHYYFPIKTVIGRFLTFLSNPGAIQGEKGTILTIVTGITQE